MRRLVGIPAEPASTATRWQRLVLDQMPLAYVELSSSLAVTEWSPAAERIFEYGRAEATPTERART